MGSYEPVVDVKAQMPKGYGFLKKGNAYRTGLCRRLTHAGGKTLFVVTERRKPIGLRAPKNILAEVFKEDKATKEKRRAAVEKRDEATQDEFKDAILDQFPNIPAESLSTILSHALSKRSGRVGRTGTLALDTKARLAVTAHIRHRHTEYETAIRNKSVTKRDAREMVHGDVVRVSQDWRGGEGKHRRTQAKKDKKKKQQSGSRQSQAKPQPIRGQTTGAKCKAPGTKNRTTKTANTTNPKQKKHEDQRDIGSQRRPTRSTRDQDSQLEMLGDFNGEDEPIVIDSSSEESDAGEFRDVTDIEDVDREELDEYSDEFIVHDTDDDDDEDFELSWI